MKRETNLLFRVASQNENTVTELLVNMMSKKYIRDVFLKSISISNEIIDNIEYKDISTQVSIINNKRPDIVIENKDLVVFIENKIYVDTQLQSSQVTDYYNELNMKNKNTKLMVFLLPRDYIHFNSIDTARKKYIDYKIQTIIMYWDDIINIFYDSDITDSNASIHEAISYLIKTLGLNAVTKSFSKGEIAYMFDYHTLKNVNSLFLRTKKFHRGNCKENMALPALWWEATEYARINT